MSEAGGRFAVQIVSSVTTSRLLTAHYFAVETPGRALVTARFPLVDNATPLAPVLGASQAVAPDTHTHDGPHGESSHCGHAGHHARTSVAVPWVISDRSHLG